MTATFSKEDWDWFLEPIVMPRVLSHVWELQPPGLPLLRLKVRIVRKPCGDVTVEVLTDDD